VRDEQGRRRLHGAFTGGFSAGYFNTVGSKEGTFISISLTLVFYDRIFSGWTPSTFVSSRSDRAKQKGSRPEDFMDEEDLAELREGQKLVDTNDEMDLLGGTQAELGRAGGVEEPEKE
jgi:G patch domain-containing protein 1